MATAPIITCVSCFYWRLNPSLMSHGGNSSARLGHCHRRSPEALAVGDPARVVSRWPITREDAFCGEHAEAARD